MCVSVHVLLAESCRFEQVVSSPKAWTDANQYCADTYGTSLAKIRDESDAMNMQLRCDLADRFWIGLNDRAQGNTWRWADGTLWYVCVYMHACVGGCFMRPIPQTTLHGGLVHDCGYWCSWSCSCMAFGLLVRALLALLHPLWRAGARLALLIARQYSLQSINLKQT